MIERISRCLCRLDGYGENVVDKGRPMWMNYRDHARIILVEMREPTQPMLRAGAYVDWTGMIDAALRPA